MSKTLTLVPNKPKAWLLLLVWASLIIFAGKFVINDALRYYGFDEEVYGRFWIMKCPTMIWVSWVIPLFITEIILQWNKK